MPGEALDRLLDVFCRVLLLLLILTLPLCNSLQFHSPLIYMNVV